MHTWFKTNVAKVMNINACELKYGVENTNIFSFFIVIPCL